MSQHDFDIANQTASNARADINNALKALGSLSSGATAPATTYANMLWYDTATNILKQRNEANSAWINVGYYDQAGSQFQIFDDTKVVNTSGTQTGLIGDQATSAWETGTGTTESLVSPAKVKAAVDALAPQSIDYSTGYSSFTFTSTTMQNTTGKTRLLYVQYRNGNISVSDDGTNYTQISSAGAANIYFDLLWFPDHYVQYSGTIVGATIIG